MKASEVWNESANFFQRTLIISLFWLKIEAYAKEWPSLIMFQFSLYLPVPFSKLQFFSFVFAWIGYDDLGWKKKFIPLEMNRNH